jgi:DNA-binding XRE family transcriptional regulator
MGEGGMTASLPGLTEYIQPDAPKDFRPGRKCEWCKAKVNRYRRRMGADDKGKGGPLLCGICAKDYLHEDLAKAIEDEAKRQGNQHVFYLPKLAKARLNYCEKGQRRELSQRALAKMVGTNDTTISKIERGEQGATQTMSHNIARSLGVSVEQLRGKA